LGSSRRASGSGHNRHVHLRFLCFKCPPEVGERSVRVEVEDEAIYRFTCPSGHESAHLLGNPKFEILFEMGLLAFNDGYTREAVATFAAAFEEFMRVFVTMVLAKHKLAVDPSFPDLVPFWKSVNRSEPQTGAFVALYFVEKGSVPEYPDQKSTQFRNDVIHKGRIPKAGEVAGYAQKILSFILPIYREYQSSTVWLLATTLESRTRERNTADVTVTNFYGSAIRNLLSAPGEPTFEAAVAFANTGFLRMGAT